VEQLRKFGVLQACPLCRTALPAGPEKLLDNTTRLYVTLLRKVESGKASWHTLAASQKNLMAEVVAMWTTAADQGNVVAQFNLSVMYFIGRGVNEDLKEAARWFQKSAGQGHADAQHNFGGM
jgi:TPR repeat protein